jgi:hypothetical protein
MYYGRIVLTKDEVEQWRAGTLDADHWSTRYQKKCREWLVA